MKQSVVTFKELLKDYTQLKEEVNELRKALEVLDDELERGTAHTTIEKIYESKNTELKDMERKKYVVASGAECASDFFIPEPMPKEGPFPQAPQPFSKEDF